MPDKDDKNSGKTSLPDQYDRTSQEVKESHRDDASFKSSEDREANAPRNQDTPDDVKEARQVPATKQG
ncbi:hypothetical protein [Deinococcus sonorensis]|uniref:Uncharacterized protein n=2 Tax=Deinococcus sonorensis TaxID=309891 RepID=A0AAU7UDH7_9DEIO